MKSCLADLTHRENLRQKAALQRVYSIVKEMLGNPRKDDYLLYFYCRFATVQV